MNLVAHETKVGSALRLVVVDDRHAGSLLRAQRVRHVALRGQRASLHPPGVLINAQGLALHTRVWLTTSVARAGVVLLVHGFGEHSGRYEHVAAAFNAACFDVYALDHQGHGRSEGERAYVQRLGHFVDDLAQFVRERVAPDAAGRTLRHPGVRAPLFCIGHSMGGLLAYLLTSRGDPGTATQWSGVVYSAPAFVPDPAIATPLNRFLAGALSSVAPKLALEKLDGSKVTRSAATNATYALDPLVYHGGIKIRLGAELLGGFGIVAESQARYELPFLIQHGTADALCELSGSRAFHAAARSVDKTKVEYDDFYHEIYNETALDAEADASGVNRALRDAVAWVAERAA